MSYLDPIRKQLEEAMPVEKDWFSIFLFGSAWLFLAMAYAIHFWIYPVPEGLAEPLWDLIALMLGLLILGGYVTTAIVIVLRDGLPRTWQRLYGFLHAYYRRNVIGCTLMLISQSEGRIVPTVVNRKGRRWRPNAELGQVFVVPLGGWFRKGEYLHGGVRLNWGVQLGPRWGDELTVRLRLADKISFVFPVDWIMGVLYDLEKSGIDTRLSWNSLIQRLRAQWMIEQDRADCATREFEEVCARTAAWSRSYLQLIDRIMQTKRFQHSKEAEQILRLALEDLAVALYSAGSEGRAFWQRQLDQLNERIAKREAKSKPDIMEGAR